MSSLGGFAGIVRAAPGGDPDVGGAMARLGRTGAARRLARPGVDGRGLAACVGTVAGSPYWLGLRRWAAFQVGPVGAGEAELLVEPVRVGGVHAQAETRPGPAIDHCFFQLVPQPP